VPLKNAYPGTIGSQGGNEGGGASEGGKWRRRQNQKRMGTGKSKPHWQPHLIWRSGGRGKTHIHSLRLFLYSTSCNRGPNLTFFNARKKTGLCHPPIGPFSARRGSSIRVASVGRKIKGESVLLKDVTPAPVRETCIPLQRLVAK